MVNKIQSDISIETTRKAYQQIYKQYSTSNTTIPERVEEMLDRFISQLQGKSVLD